MFPYPEPQYLSDKSFYGHPELLPILFPFSPAAFNNDSIQALVPHLLLPAQNTATPLPSPDSPPTKQLPAANTRKRALRKDRHSKICTAQGLRDRRMRLSLDVARRFFDLQDLLGFDKASKTVQWLLNMSDYAVKSLIPKEHAVSESSTSECENISPVADVVDKRKPPPLNNRKGKKITTSRKSAPHPILTKASRANARERARERTIEKKKIKVGSMEDESGSTPHDNSSSLQMAAKVAQKSSSPSHHDQCNTERSYQFAMGEAGVGLNDDHIFDYNHDAIRLLQEQSGMNIVANIEEQRDLMVDVQFHARSWEVFNNNNRIL